MRGWGYCSYRRLLNSVRLGLSGRLRPADGIGSA